MRRATSTPRRASPTPPAPPATPITPIADPTGASRATRRAAASTSATPPHSPLLGNESRPAQRPAPNATLIHSSGGRTAASACYTSCTGFAPQRGASPTLRNPSSSTTSSLARSWSLASDSSVSTSPWCVEQGDLVTARAGREQPAPLRLPLHQHLVRRADERDVLRARHLAHHGDEPLQPLPRHRVGDAVLELDGRGAIPQRILEGVGVVEPNLTDERDRLLEVLLRLAREADDDVGRERDPGDGAPQRRRDLEVALPRVAAQHPPEHSVRAALHREVHVLARRSGLSHRGEHPLAEVRGIGRGEAQAADPGHAAGRAQQVREVVLAVVIAVDRLAKERHLRGTARGETLDLAHHVGQLAAALRPARHRNDAERAPIIAATLHRYEGGGTGCARRCLRLRN